MKRIAILLCALLILIPSFALAGETMYPSGETAIYSDGWLYFTMYYDGRTCIIKARPDGSEGQVLTERIGSFSVADDIVYVSSGDKVFRMKTDGRELTEYEMIGEFGWWVGGICVTEEFVYLGADQPIGENDYRNVLFKYQKDPWKLVLTIPIGEASPEKKLIVDDWIYLSGYSYELGSKLYRMRTDGSELTVILSPGAQWETSMWDIQGDWMYYGLADPVAGEAQLRRAKLDGTGDELMIEGLRVEWIVDGWAYGYTYADEITRVDPYTWGEPDADYHDYSGTYRVSLETGEWQDLFGQSLLQLVPAGEYILDEQYNGWSSGPIILLNPNLSKKGQFPPEEEDMGDW